MNTDGLDHQLRTIQKSVFMAVRSLAGVVHDSKGLLNWTKDLGENREIRVKN